MKKIYLVLLIILISGSIYSQKEADFTQYNWQTFNTSYQDNLENLIRDKNIELGLADDDNLLLYKQDIDDLRIEHYRYHQIHKGVKVEGADYLIHRSADKMWGNGRLVYGIEADPNPGISENEALQKALDYFGAEKYYWEDESQEKMIKWIKNDPIATYKPKGELVFAEGQYSQDGKGYQLLWKFDIHGHGEKLREYVYVNAQNGAIAYGLDAIKYFDSEATEQTHYYGERTIITDSIASDVYHLEDCTRGGGIVTYNMNNTWEFTSEDHFIDADNYWDNANVDLDDAATDAHWSMEMTYDFYWDNYEWNSYDGNGSKMVAKVHTGPPPFSAFFTGLYIALGDGNGNPNTYIELIGHEFTHGVTSKKSGLVGFFEPGVVNESFSNVLGTAIEFNALPDQADWIFHGQGGPLIYDMANPNSSNRPDTYLGDFWFYDATATGAYTHINMAFMDFWFYLLSEGGSGVNDIGNVYAVDSIGIEKATDIVYRNISYYITATSGFEDARQGSIQSATDLYGECSNEVEQVINAWHAVGLGSFDYDQDLELIEIVSPANHCGLTNEEVVEVRVLYNVSGCPDTIPAGSEIEMTYQIDNNTAIVETWTLDEDMIEGESYNYSFEEMISIQDTGEFFDLFVWIDFSPDNIDINDHIQRDDIGLRFGVPCDTAITFEDPSTAVDYFYTEVGEFAKAEISSLAENTGNYGFLLGVADISAGPKEVAEDPSLNFESQQEYISKICFCVDATEWESVSLSFDMKQTYSMLYNYFWGDEIDTADYVSSMRMLINGVQFEEQFHPETFVDDAYESYNYDLDQLAGSSFEFCFQSKNYVNDIGDNSFFLNYDSDGDNTYLDNIRFSCEAIVGIEEPELENISIYPNPASDILFIESNNRIEDLDISMFNQLGQRVLYIQNIRGPIDISLLEPGVYIIEIRSENGMKREKVVIQ
jgi:Zn-dependent metalloprotease